MRSHFLICASTFASTGAVDALLRRPLCYYVFPPNALLHAHTSTPVKLNSNRYRDVCMGIYPNLPKLFSIQCMPRTPFAVVATPEAQVFVMLRNHGLHSYVILLHEDELLRDFSFKVPYLSHAFLHSYVPHPQAAAAPAAYYLGGSGDGTRPGTFFVNTSNLASRPTYEVQ